MGVEICPLAPLPTEPIDHWCHARSRFLHPTAEYRQGLLSSSETSWPSPRGHTCRTCCPEPAADIAAQSIASLCAAATQPAALTICVSERDAPEKDSTRSKKTQAKHKTPAPTPISMPTPTKVRHPVQSPIDTDMSQPTTPEPRLKHRRFTFPISAPDTIRPTFTFPRTTPLSPSRPNLKRPRLASDVDGPHTADLGCKKRRLRLQLVTSRLSQPFSLPATHILNREALAAGDRRFLKMAAHVEMVRRGWDVGHSAASFRRFAVLNTTRARLRGNWTELSGVLSCPPRGASAPPSPGGGARGVAGQVQFPKAMKAPLAQQRQPCLPAPPALVTPRQPGPVVAAAAAASPPRSKEPVRPAETRSLYDDAPDEDEDDGCEAFPSAYDSDNDSEDVYSDFGDIFTESGDAGRPFEEYLDELDGISWAVR